MTLHQIGTVFDRASGMRLPARVESTRTILVKRLVKWDRAGTGACYLPSLLHNQGEQMQIGTAKIETPVIGMPIGGLEVCRRVGRL